MIVEPIYVFVKQVNGVSTDIQATVVEGNLCAVQFHVRLSGNPPALVAEDF